MKKLLLFLAAVAMTTGCKQREPNITTAYTYINDTDKEITISSHCPNIINGEIRPGRDSVFTISPGANHFLSFHGDNVVPPLNWQGGSSYGEDYSVISNGETTIVQREALRDELYDLSKYTVLYHSDVELRYQYIFTDDFFENGEPIE